MSIPLATSQYEVIRHIGNTKFSSIYMVRCITDGQLFSMEQMDLETAPLEIKTIHHDISYWSNFSHDNMLKYYGSFVEQNTLYIIFEMVSDGNLLDILHFKYADGIKDESLIATILHGVVLFLNYYHENHHVHRKLETKNILITKKGDIKVSGFWNARSLIVNGKLHPTRGSIVPSSCYSSPEIIVKGTGYNQSTDIWSLGIIALELALGKAPYSNLEPLRQIRAIIDDDPPNLPIEASKTPVFSPIFRDFISQCLQKDHHKRPTASELLKHKFFARAKDNKYIYINLIAHMPPLAHRLTHKTKSGSHDSLNQNRSNTLIASSIDSFDFCGFDTAHDGQNKSHSMTQISSRRYSHPSKNITNSINLTDKKEHEGTLKVVQKGRFTYFIPVTND